MCPPADLPKSEVATAALPISIPTCVPSDPVSQSAFKHAAQELHPIILNHSIRVYLHARKISEQEVLSYHADAKLHTLLFVACIFHDIGTSRTYDTGPTRFEIEGADAAVTFLSESPHFTAEEKHDVWVAIAIHDTPQIAERISPLARLVRLGVTIDFKRPSSLAMVSEEWIKEIEDTFMRGKIEEVLGDAVVEQALKTPEKAPVNCWPGGLYRWKLENLDSQGVNGAF